MSNFVAFLVTQAFRLWGAEFNGECTTIALFLPKLRVCLCVCLCVCRCVCLSLNEREMKDEKLVLCFQEDNTAFCVVAETGG